MILLPEYKYLPHIVYPTVLPTVYSTIINTHTNNNKSYILTSEIKILEKIDARLFFVKLLFFYL